MQQVWDDHHCCHQRKKFTLVDISLLIAKVFFHPVKDSLQNLATAYVFDARLCLRDNDTSALKTKQDTDSQIQ